MNKSRIFAVSIGLLLGLAWVLALTSCSIIKNKQKEKYKSEVHHYHDSTFTIEKLTTSEIKTVGDSTKGTFDLEALLKSGYGKSTDRYFTTEVRLKDGSLEVLTKFDSLVQIITQMERTIGSFQTTIDYKENKKGTITSVAITNYIPFAIFLIILLVICFLIFRYRKKIATLKSRIS